MLTTRLVAFFGLTCVPEEPGFRGNAFLKKGSRISAQFLRLTGLDSLDQSRDVELGFGSRSLEADLR